MLCNIRSISTPATRETCSTAASIRSLTDTFTSGTPPFIILFFALRQ